MLKRSLRLAAIAFVAALAIFGALYLCGVIVGDDVAPRSGQASVSVSAAVFFLSLAWGKGSAKLKR